MIPPEKHPTIRFPKNHRRYINPIMPHFKVLLILLVMSAAALAQNNRPNILFIAVDDLRPELGCYGEAHIVSPNIDRLAETGIRFDRAYCMVPTCGASLASLMSGIRPTPDRFVSFTARIDKEAPHITALHEHFKNHGYTTLSLGKILHFPEDTPEGWSEPAWRPDRKVRPESEMIPGWNIPSDFEELNERSRNQQLPFGYLDVDDDVLPDGQVAQEAIRRLQTLSEQNQPFFLAVGFFKPHLPFNAPKKYWGLYDHRDIKIPENYYPPTDAPEEAIHNFGELRNYTAVPKQGKVSDDMARALIHGYYACVSYTDAQIGRVLDELDRLGLSNNTIVVLWGDHGWNLGEHTLWCKHCTFETAMRAPLIFRMPNQTIPKAGITTSALAEFIDIYPTLSELAGLPLPQHLQGQSLVPLFTSPSDQGKGYAVGRFRNGDTIRTDRWRYTQYETLPATRAGSELPQMLYDHRTDPDENTNLAYDPRYHATVTYLAKQLNDLKGR